MDAPFTPDIAIIGLAGRFPGARDVRQLWTNLAAGVESVSFFSQDELAVSGVSPELTRSPRYVPAAAVLEDIDQFDAAFFGYAPREAATIDPQQRLFLECAYQALEDAAYDPSTLDARVGVYAGVGVNTYLLFNLARSNVFSAAHDFYPLLIGNGHDFLATRVCYKLDLRGPGMTVQSACSTSLVALHLACQALLNQECDMALAGGVAVRVPHRVGYLYQDGGILSPDGHCRAFDAEALGTVGGNGVGIVVVKRLADAQRDRDHIRAVIKGTAVNNDGSVKVGFTAPSVEGQVAAITEALSVAQVPAESISYIETHGTGTPLGDRIELAALRRSLGSERGRPPVAIGSAKTNLGHLDAAAAITGVIKTTLALEHRLIPPSLNCTQPSADLAGTPFYVNTVLSEWHRNGTPRRAGVSSFGIGGTNAHAVLEEAPDVAPEPSSRAVHVLTLSARSAAALDQATTNLAQHLASNPDDHLADVAHTLLVGRRAFPHRRAIACHDRDDAVQALRGERGADRVATGVADGAPRPITFLFPGQGPQYAHMARGLYEHEPVFRHHIERCAAILQPLIGRDVREVLFPPGGAPDQLHEMALAHPALFAVEYALAQLWMSWGLEPSAMIGHSFGEYVAACLADVFSLEDGLALISLRGQLMHDQPGGAMLAVNLSADTLQFRLDNGLTLAAINSPTSCVVSGPSDVLADFAADLAHESIEHRRLPIQHAAHSAAMAPAVKPLVAAFSRVTLRPPRIPYLSNVSGAWITDDEATDPAYWGRHLVETVRFADGLSKLCQDERRLYVEVGPGRTLAAFVRQTRPGRTVLPSLRHPQDHRADEEFALHSLGRAWTDGATVQWAALYANERRRRVSLPTYPFERQRYWIEPDNAQPPAPRQPVPPAPGQPPTARVARESSSLDSQLATIWSTLLGVDHVGPDDSFFDLGGDSLLAVQLITRIKDRTGIELQLQQVLEAPTVASMARLLERSRPAARRSSVVALNRAGSRTPLFLVHPAGGTVLCYVDLVRLLGPDQPVYALQSPGLVGETEPTTIEAAAERYVSDLREIQPHGPYRLAGLSYGGNVAFEMARQLQDVQLLAMFDSHPPAAYHTEPPDEASYVLAFPSILQLYAGRQPRIQRADLQGLDSEAQLDYLLKRIRAAHVLPREVDDAGIKLLFRLWKTHLLALRRHRPEPLRHAQHISFFRAAEPQPPRLPRLLHIDLHQEAEAWQSLTRGAVALHEVPGSHYTMLRPGNVESLAASLVGAEVAHAR